MPVTIDNSVTPPDNGRPILWRPRCISLPQTRAGTASDWWLAIAHDADRRATRFCRDGGDGRALWRQDREQHGANFSGYLGVGVFFTLSGFLITGLLLRSFEAFGDARGRALRNFYARRMLRLAPPFYLVLGALVLIGLEPVASSWPWHAAYLTNVWVAMGNPSNVFWSLAVEEQFYLIWPLLLLVAGRSNALKLAIGVVIAGVAFRAGWLMAGFDTRAAIYLLFANLVLLGLGAVCAVLSYKDGRPFQFQWFTPRVQRRSGFVALAAFSLAVATWLVHGNQGALRFLTLDLLAGTAFCWLILKSAVGWSGWRRAVMTAPILLFIGKISYTLYLTHNFVPKVFELWLGQLPDWQLLAMSLPTVFVISTASWYLMEKPLLQLKHHFPEVPSPAAGLGGAKDPHSLDAALASRPPTSR